MTGPDIKRDGEYTPPVDNTEEVERKYTVDLTRMPEIAFESIQTIRQGYVAIGADKSELRVREITDADGTVGYTMNMKVGKGFVRFEPLDEVPIPKDLFDELWAKAEPDILEKIRSSIHFGTHKLAVDQYIDPANAGLVVAEVEFYGASLEEKLAAVERFIVPDWFTEDVTENPEYKNQALARKARKLAQQGIQVALGDQVRSVD